MAGIYIHIPFCERKCIYCDFHSVETTDQLDVFLRSLEREINLYSEKCKPMEFETVYFGGGTPSLLSPSQVEEILCQLHAGFKISPMAEVTLEANPGTVDEEKLQSLKSIGINRLSIGVQSFHDDELRFLSRIHSAKQAKECIRSALRAGFDNISLDLIFGLPDQSLEQWKDNLQKAVGFEPKHISAYSLILEEGTPLYTMVREKNVQPLSIEADAAMYEWTIDFLASRGYEHYEVSNFAQPGYRSRHNSNYWNHTSYIGLGPSAHSLWNGKRWWNHRDVETYCNALLNCQTAVAGSEVLSTQTLLFESIFLALRSDGIRLDEFRRRFQFDFDKRYADKIRQFVADGLMRHDNDNVRLTKNGLMVCDEICQAFI